MGNCNACIRPEEASKSDPRAKSKKTRERRPNPYSGSPAPIRVLKDFFPKTRISDKYILGRELGRGEFGVTYLCTDRETREALACKSISKKKLRTAVDIEDVRREVAIMSSLPDHPNIVKLRATYEDNEAVHLVMELCEGGELFDRIVARGHYSERAAAGVARTVAEVVRMCHANGVMHRDLKPENFLFANKKEHSALKAIDFGLSVFFKPGTTSNFLTHNWIRKTPISSVSQKSILFSLCFKWQFHTHKSVWFLVVIFVINQEKDSLRLWEVHTTWRQKCWSGIMDQKLIFGVLVSSFIFCYVGFLHFGLVYIVFFQFPVEFWCLQLFVVLEFKFFSLIWLSSAETEQGVALAILRGVIDFKREPWPQVSEKAKSLVRQMLEPDPKKRLTAQQVLGKYFSTQSLWTSK